MAQIILSPLPHQVPVLTKPNEYPEVLTQFVPTPTPESRHEQQPITCATIGVNPVVLSPEELQQEREHTTRLRVFEPIALHKKRGPLVIHDKRWYFRLVQARAGDTTRRSRALMDDYNLNQIAHHMVVCFTPDRLPDNDRPFRTQEGEPGRIYAFFDSYVEFYEYMQRFDRSERAFYEVIFGELPQKPHFDIDIDRDVLSLAFPADDIDTTAEILRECVIGGCFEVLREHGVILDLTRDLLLYSSHGPNKRSYHIVLNNKCHDGNKEAKVFYDAVMEKVHGYTQGKYRGLNLIDKGVYSPRQQFRLVGCQKWNSGRPKVFYEQFWYSGQQYTHTYTETTTDERQKKFTIIYESMVSFTSGCAFLPSLVPEKPINHNQLGDMPDLEGTVVDQCMTMLREKMNPCPFAKREVRGHLIILRRLAPSFCPICHTSPNETEPHRKEHPYMFIVGGKVYWDCRRSDANAKKFFVGYLAMTLDELQTGTAITGVIEQEETEDTGGEFMFGDYDIGQPTLPPITKQPSPSVPVIAPVTIPQAQGAPFPKFDLPPEQRMQNMPERILQLARDRAQQKYLNHEPEDLTGRVSLSSVRSQIVWNAGLH